MDEDIDSCKDHTINRIIEGKEDEWDEDGGGNETVVDDDNGYRGEDDEAKVIMECCSQSL